MLRNQGIRTKLLAVLALPIVALIVMATVVSLQTFGQARKASEVEKLARGADTLGRLVTAIQSERSISAQLLDKKPVVGQVQKSRERTDAALVKTKALLDSVDIRNLSPQAVAAVAAATSGHAQLGNVRAQVDSGFAQPDRINERYTSMIAGDITLSSRIGMGLENRAIGRQLSVYSSAQTLAEVATQERELILTMIAQGTVDSRTGSALARITAQENEALRSFSLDATKAQREALDTAVYLPVEQRAAYGSMKAEVGALATGDKVTLNSSEWRNASNDRLNALQKLLPSIAASTGDDAAAASSSASNTALLVLVAGLALVVLLLGLGLVLARAITRPLRHLTRVATEVADELPRMVERMATPGEGPGVTLPEIPFTADDEVGQLASAFREVNDTTIRVAEEQAALRASIAEMFVNVARRNHVLLSRQLSFIDQLERSEENPDTLDNLFRLDHLATRMRRNAESLIVLAGIDAGRRLRRPMPMSDVIRTAVSEIERYDRVDLSLQADPPMVGHVALTTAHLLAELLENATQFSNPDTRVVTSTAFTSRGVRITITDLGLGMTWDEINEANQRIASPPATEVVGSQRLGFYVVGRLSRRLDVTVELKPGRAQGTVVTIDLPPALFVSGTVVDSTPAGDAPAVPHRPSDGSRTEPAEESGAPSGSDPVSPGTISGLPSRGTGAPSVPSASPAVPPAPGEPGDDGLPRRSAGAPTAPVAESVAPAADAPAAPPAPRAGMFSSFRSRRVVESEVGAAAPPDPTSLDALANDLPEFVPTLDTATPALPHRSDVAATPTLPQRDHDADGASGEGTDLVDAPVTDGVIQGETLVPDDDTMVPGFADEPTTDTDDAVVTELPSRRVSPLDDEWQPEPLPADEPPAEPLIALLDDESDPLAGPGSVAAEPQPTAIVPEADVAVGDPAVSDPVVSDPVVSDPAVAESPAPLAADETLSGSQARSTLSELAREAEVGPDEPDAVDGAADDGPAVVSPDAPVPTVPAVPVTPVGAPAMDILPSRSGGRGLRRRRTSRPKATRAGSGTSHRSESPVSTSSHGPEPVTPAPVPAVPPTPAAPAAPATSTPAFVNPAPEDTSPVPMPAPSGLFTPPPSDAGDDTPSAAAPTPAFPPASVPALVAAQSLRERSAMASEALSELSALSSYRPEAMTANAEPSSLVRRTPQSTPAAQTAEPHEPQGQRRANRNAADVRSMLSGFRAGVERGRTSSGGMAGGSAPTGQQDDEDA